MSTVVVYAVLGAGLIHAVWNAIAKSFHDQFVSFALLNFGIAVVCWVSWPFIGLPRSASLGYLAFSVLCHLGYELFLMRSYQRSDFSQSYPIARGLAPLLVTLGGLVFASEHLSVPVLIGVMAVVIGIASLAARRGDARMVRSGLLWALATGAAIATYTVVDGLGVRSSHSALRYAAALFAVQSGMWLAGSVLGRGNRPWPSPRLTGLGMLSGVLSMVGYVIVLWAQIRAPLGIVSALRETGVLWAAVIGAVVFHERRLRQVAVPALLVAAGISLLGFG